MIEQTTDFYIFSHENREKRKLPSFFRQPGCPSLLLQPWLPARLNKQTHLHFVKWEINLKRKYWIPTLFKKIYIDIMIFSLSDRVALWDYEDLQFTRINYFEKITETYKLWLNRSDDNIWRRASFRY